MARFFNFSDFEMFMKDVSSLQKISFMLEIIIIIQASPAFLAFYNKLSISWSVVNLPGNLF
jgi:hypothetical protein